MLHIDPGTLSRVEHGRTRLSASQRRELIALLNS
jgi:hypothetical protein